MASFLLIALWITYTVACFVIYHKFVKVYYFGSMFKGIMSEIITCLIISSLLCAVTVWFWWVAVIILIIATIIIRGKIKDANLKTGITVLMVAVIFVVAIGGMQIRNGSKGSIYESNSIADDEMSDSSIESNITDEGIFNTPEEQEAYLAETEPQEIADAEYEQYLDNIDSHVLECEGDSPLDFLDEISTKRQVEERFGMSEDYDDFFSTYYNQVVFKGFVGQYSIDYNVNGVIDSAIWVCESDDIEKSSNTINDLISYYKNKYGDYEKMELEQYQNTMYSWSMSPYSISITVNNNSIEFSVGAVYPNDQYNEYGRSNFKVGEAWYRRSDGLLLQPEVSNRCSIRFTDDRTYIGSIDECMLGSTDLLYYDGTSSYTSWHREYPGLVIELKLQDDNNSLVVQQTGTIPDYPNIDLTGEYTFDENAWNDDTEVVNVSDNYAITASSEVYTDEFNDSSFIFPYSSDEYLSMKELEGLSAEECKIARNEIYARHGRQFTDEALQAYFDSCDWYTGSIAPEDFDEDSLSDIEKANRDLIIEYEKEMGYIE